MTPDHVEHLQGSGTLSPVTASLWMEAKNSYTGPGLVSTADEWPDSCCFRPGSREWQPQRGIVVVEQQALGSTVWAALAPLLGDLVQVVVDIPIGVDCPPVLKRYGGCMDREARHHLLYNTLRLFEFHMWGLTCEDPHTRLLLCFGFVLKDLCFITSYNVPDMTKSSSLELLAPFDPTSLLLFCQVVRDQKAQCFETLRWSWKIWFTLPDKNARCILYLFMCSSVRASHWRGRLEEAIEEDVLFWGLPWSETLL